MLYNPDGQVDYTPVQQMRDDLTETLRSVKDTIAMSFQQLNLTLSSMNGTLRNMASYAPSASAQNVSNYMPSSQNLYLGNMSPAMAQYNATASGFNLAGLTGNRPFNISPMEFYLQREREMKARAGVFGAGVGVDIANGIATGSAFWAGNKLVANPNILRGVFGRSLMLPIGMSMAVGMATGPMFDAFEKESQNYAQDAASFQRLGARFSGGTIGYGAASNMSGWLNTAGMREYRSQRWDSTMLGTEGYRDLAMTGLANGLFTGNGTTELKKQIEGAAQMVRFLAGIMGSNDVKEAINAIMQMKQMGFNPITAPGVMQNIGKSMFGLGAVSGLSAGQMTNMGLSIGNQVQQNMRLPGILGMRYGTQGYAQAIGLERMGVLSPTDMALAGGAQGAASLYAHGMSQAASDPAFGGMLMAAMMGPNGGLSTSRNIGGGYFGMMGSAMNNILTPGRMAMYMTNKNNLLAEYAQTGMGSNGMHGMIRSALAPMLDASGARGREERVALATQILITRGMDPTAAKMVATTSIYPEHERRVKASAMTEIEAGRAAERRAQYTIGASFGRLKHSVGGLWEGLYSGVITDPAQATTRWSSELFGDGVIERGRELAMAKTQGFNIEDLSPSSSSLYGGNSSIANATLDDYYNNTASQRGTGVKLANGYWMSPRTNALSPDLDAFQRHNVYGEYYDKYVKGSTSEGNIIKRAYDYAGMEISKSDYLSSNFYGKHGGGLEYVASKLDRSARLASISGGMDDNTAHATLTQYLGHSPSGVTAATLEHQIIQKMKDNGDKAMPTEVRRALAQYSSRKDGTNISSATLLQGDSNLFKLAGDIEAGFTDPTKLQNIIDTGLPGKSPAAMDDLLYTTGVGIKDLVGFSKSMREDSSITDNDYKIAAKYLHQAHRGIGEKALGILNSPSTLYSTLFGRKEEALASGNREIGSKSMQSIFAKLMSSGDFEGKSEQEIENIIRSIPKAAGSVADEQFRHTAKYIWNIKDDKQISALQDVIAGRDVDKINAYLSSNSQLFEESPALQDLKDTTGDIGRVLNKYRGKTFGMLNNDAQDEVRAAFKLDNLNKTSDGNTSIEKLGERALAVGINTAQVSSKEKFEDSNKRLENTIINVNGQAAMAVVVMEPLDKKVLQITADGKSAIREIYLNGKPVEGQGPGKGSTKAEKPSEYSMPSNPHEA